MRNYSSINGIHGRLCVRNLMNGTWTPWSKVYDSENKPTFADIGALPSTTKYAASDSVGGAANSLKYFKSTASTNVGLNDVDSNAIGYVDELYFGNVTPSGLNDGALYRQVYNSLLAHEIFGDYMTGRIMTRGRKDGTWQPWLTNIDSGNIGAQFVNRALGLQSINDDSIAYNGNYLIKSKYINNKKFKLFIDNNHPTDTVKYDVAVDYADNADNAYTLDNRTSSTDNDANTVVVRNSNKYIYVGYVNSETSKNENIDINQFVVTNATDNFYRKVSVSKAKTALGLDTYLPLSGGTLTGSLNLAIGKVLNL